jgi:hypothetical protein
VDAVVGWTNNHPTSVLVVLLALAAVLAWRFRFVQDDAFISFNYARSLVQGTGLTWFGARVEGYTNFLWVLWIALGMKLGAEPVIWSQVGGTLSFLAMIHGTWMLARVTLREVVPTLFAVLFTLSNYSVLVYATGGLETMLQTALLCQALALLCRMREDQTFSAMRILGLSLVLSLAVLNRLDGALPGMVIAGYVGVALAKRRTSVRTWLLLVLPPVLIVGSWMVWRLLYYGSVLPLSFYAKVRPSLGTLIDGARYVWHFMHWYFVWPIAGLGLAVLMLSRRESNPRLRPLLAVVLSWIAYVIIAGGDFMEFRFLVPIAPVAFVLLAFLVYTQLGKVLLGRPILACVAAFGILAVASVRHATRTDFSGLGFDNIKSLSTFYGTYPDQNWGLIGDRLRQQLSATDAVIATTAAGAVPYYSGLQTVDMLGLNDACVARHGTVSRSAIPKPGHERYATLEYLHSRHVNLIVGHPRVVERGLTSSQNVVPVFDQWVKRLAFSDLDQEAELTLVVMPLDEQRGLLMWYLNPTRMLDSVIAANQWEVVRLNRGTQPR